MLANTRIRGRHASAVLATWLLVHGVPALAEEDGQQITATIELTVPEVAPVAGRLEALLDARGARDRNTSSTAEYANATVRLAPEEVASFLDAVAVLGTVTRREVTATDVRAELKACTAQERQEQQALARLESAKSNDSDEAIRLADAIRQRRAELEASTENCRATREATERATVTVAVSIPHPHGEHVAEPRFFPGVRFSHLLDVGNAGATGLLGLGLTASFAEHVGFEFELFRDLGGGSSFVDAFLASAGFDITSALFGSGERRFLNPHLGVRIGVSAVHARVDFATAATLGLEVVKLRWLRLDAQVRLWGFFGNADGARLGVQSGVVASFGF